MYNFLFDYMYYENGKERIIEFYNTQYSVDSTYIKLCKIVVSDMVKY